MKCHLEQGILVQVLQKVLSITEKKTSMPILTHVMLKASEPDSGVLDFSATDLELSLWTQIKCTVDSPGTTTVSARKLLEIVRELAQKTITMETLSNDRLLIVAGRSRFELPTMPAADFPYLKSYEKSHMEPCDGGILRKCLEKTLYGIPLDDDPFSVSGLFLHPVDADSLRFVASDGHRLVFYRVAQSAFAGFEIGEGIIIPRKGVVEIIRILEKESDISMGMDENCLIIKTPMTTLSIQLLEGTFPEYEMIIPAERPFHFTAEREAFFHALKRVAVLTDHRWRHVRLTIVDGALELQGGNPELGNADDALDIVYQGEGFSVAFNIRYVLDTLQAMEGSQVFFEWVDEYHGGVFRSDEDPDYFGLIMPMVLS